MIVLQNTHAQPTCDVIQNRFVSSALPRPVYQSNDVPATEGFRADKIPTLYFISDYCL